MSNRRFVRTVTAGAMLCAFAVPATSALADHTRPPVSVALVGSLQSELGCPGDWQPDCALTELTADPSGAWFGSFDLPAGSWEYKVALNDTWDESHPAGNIALELTAAATVTVVYDHATHWIADSVNDRIVTAPGSYQSELGCPGDWQPDCLASWLQDPDGDGTYALTTDALPAGDYQSKAAIDRAWLESYPIDNVPFTVGAAGDLVTFSFESATNTFTIDVDAPAPTSPVAVAGSFQSELGCPADWQPDCALTELPPGIGDVHRSTFTIPAGDWEYKVALDDAWDQSYPASNVALSVGADTDVRFYFDAGTTYVADSVNTRIVTAPGSYQDELGCPGDWQPDCLLSWLQDPDGDGVFEMTVPAGTIPAGPYEAKAAIGESWDENYGAGGAVGGDDILFTVADAHPIVFSFESATNTLSIDSDGEGGEPSTDVEPGDELLVTAPSRPLSDESIYFVMTDRFANGDPSNDTAGLPAGDGKLVHGFDATDKAFHHGGDLAGLTDRLDYIDALGVTSIWITPPFKNDYVQIDGGPGTESSSYHGYWQVDYTQIDPHYGTNAEMQAFVAAAHARGIKVIFDVVLNHTGDVITYDEGVFTYRNKADFPYLDAAGVAFDDRDYEGTGTFPTLDPATSFPYTPVIPAGEETAKAPAWLNDPIYYHNRGNSTFTGENSQYGDFFGLDDLFTEHPTVVDGMIDIHATMIDLFDVDGFRVDTVKHVSDGFWEAWVPAILDHAATAGKPEFVMFGEVFGETIELRSRYSTELDFPGTLDFSFDAVAKDFANGSRPPSQLGELFAADDWYTDTDSNAHDLAKFLGNHDIGRFGRLVQQAHPGAADDELLARVALGQALNFLTRGRPVVYYGDEQGFTGDGGDQDARQDMFPSQVASYNDDDLIGTAATTAGDNFDPTHPLFQTVSDLATLRSTHPALQTGAQITRSAPGSNGVFAVSRIDGTEQVEYVVAVNNATTTTSATFPTDTSSATWEPMWPAGAPTAVSDATGALTLDVPALGFVVYRAGTTIDRPAEATILLTAPAAGSEVLGRTEVAATTGGGYGEVTFAVSVAGGAYEVIGVDDNAPYRVFHDVSGHAPGTALTFKAIVRDAAGNLASQKVAVTVGEEEPPPPPGSGPSHAIVHYQRSDGDYGDHTTGDFGDFWGLHLWGAAIDPSEATEWTSPKPFLGEDEYGRFAWIELGDPGAEDVNFIVHRGDVKDGTDADRSFDAAANPEIWLKQDDPNTYTSQAAAQGYVTIHYRRDDGDYGTPSADSTEFWGLHLWGDAIDPSEATEWASPKPPTGSDEFGVYWEIPVADVTQPLDYIIHRGDTKDRDADQSMVPAADASIWVVAGDPADHAERGAALDYATIHYHRDDGDYGDPTSSDFGDFWGLHVWAGAASPNPSWQEPVRPTRFDLFGPVFEVPLADGAPGLAYILHRGETKDPGPDQLLEFDRFAHEVWQLEMADVDWPYILPVESSAPVSRGNLNEARAHWVSEDIVVWPGMVDDALDYSLCGAPDGGLALSDDGVSGGDCIQLTPAGTFPTGIDGRLHLAGASQFTIGTADLPLVPELLRGQLAVVAASGGERANATGVQIPGVLDDLYATDTELGVVWDGDVPTIRIWAPTAKSVTMHHFADSTSPAAATNPMSFDAGVWSITGDSSWDETYYLVEIEVYVPSTGAVEHNLVTDPHSVSLSTNSTRSQIVDLEDDEIAPDGWDLLLKPELARPEDVSVYELHVRDFSIFDPSVPPEQRGTFAAFTNTESNGMQHLEALADAGLSFVHLLPSFDIATIEEERSAQLEPDYPAMEAAVAVDPASELPQEEIAAIRDEDGFNWGYDPYHYTTPEGSYSTDPDGTTRIVEFREMVQALNQTGLRVVMDVVYNHTAAAGQSERSVLDRIVPGYYHRLDEAGNITTSTCCQNTATEHAMMGRLMIDSIVTWAKEYKVDGFRFDLMGHHSKQNLLDVRAALDELTLAEDGVDGSKIYLYGEGWNFGEVANNARFVQATQLEMAGTGIGTFSDRLRDAVRGGGPFDGGTALVTNQGFINGLWYDPNDQAMAEADALAELLLSADQIRVGLAGNLADFTFVDRNGATVTGSQVDYNGSPTGYTADPQENIVYIAAHDNQTLFDIGQYHHPLSTSTADRVRAQNVGNSIVALAQGVPFVHAGQDLLRSKSMDRDSYNSGDWFNRLDLTYQTNNWGVGLPIEEVNGDNWPLIAPRLSGLPAPSPDDIAFAAAVTQEWFRIRTSSALFRLETAAEIQARLSYGNTGPSQTPGLIAMSIRDDVDGLVDLDPAWEGMEVLVNATDEPVTYTDPSLVAAPLELHPVLAGSVDPVVRTASFDPATGAFEVPARTTAVFVDLGPDVTPPVGTAELIEIRSERTWGIYRVGAECVDARGDATASATLNGVAVEDGDLVRLIDHPSRSGWVRNRYLTFIWGTSFTLEVTCVDAVGNTSTTTTTLDIVESPPPPGGT